MKDVKITWTNQSLQMYYKIVISPHPFILGVIDDLCCYRLSQLWLNDTWGSKKMTKNHADFMPMGLELFKRPRAMYEMEH